MSKVLGIDLGTTNSVVSVLENQHPVVIQNAEGAKTTPSVVFYERDGGVVVGELAKRQSVTEPKRVIFSAKRFMGCRWDEVSERLEGIPYGLKMDEQGMMRIVIDDRELAPEQVSAEVLKKMKDTAEAYLGQEVQNAVVTVPAHFNDAQRSATKRAGELAGLTILRIVNEPTAAALAYGLNQTEQRQRIAVFDFGGGTFDISILDIEGDIIEVKSTGGDTYLGGDNINQLLCDWIVEGITQSTKIDPRSDATAMQRIRETAEKVKCELSTLEKTVISLPFIVADDEGPKHYNTEIMRSQFEMMIKPLLSRLRKPCEHALEDADMRTNQLTKVILVGGSTRIPAVRRLVKEIFGLEPDSSLNPDEVVAQGAAVQAGVMTGELAEILLLDVIPLSMGIELAGNVFSVLIPRNSNIPTTATKRFTTVVDNQTTVTIHVLQGERKMANQNRTLGKFKLTGIPPSPREIPEIEVTFNIDANGIMTVSAQDLTTGATQKIEIEPYMPSAHEADKIAAEAEKKADVDRQHVLRADVRQRLQRMESQFKEYRERANSREVIDEELEQRMREVIFKWDISLVQEDWKIIEEAERNAIGVLKEIEALFSLGESRAKKGQKLDLGLDK